MAAAIRSVIGSPGALHATIASDRRHDLELGKMSADRIDHRGLLADAQMARAIEHQAALLLGVLVTTKRMLALVTASQIASASVASCRFCGTQSGINAAARSLRTLPSQVLLQSRKGKGYWLDNIDQCPCRRRATTTVMAQGC
jgi:hypothetical protein